MWQMVEAVDGYLRRKVGPRAPVRIDVFDARGHVTNNSAHAAKIEWESHQYPINSMIATYGHQHGDETWVRVHAQDLGVDREALLSPTLVVEVTGTDPGDVRGTALEVVERAAKGEVQVSPQQFEPGPPVPAPPELPASEPCVHSFEQLGSGPRSRLNAVTHNVWFVTLIGGVIASLIGAYLWVLLT